MIESSVRSLILKPTEICDFSCDFCSSSELVSRKSDKLDLKLVSEFLDRHPQTDDIIINGGDPLMMPVQYYWDMLELLDSKKSSATISMTTNLWNYYNNPNKWIELFKHPKIDICTSFQYGDRRKINKNRVFKEEDFVRISDMFLKDVGYRPDFIAVIDEENIDKAIDTVRLAKYLDVECKLNYANASGRQGKPFPLSKIYEVYLQIYKLGLHHWEYNTKQMLNRLKAAPTACPLLSKCDEHIRVLHPDGKYFTCGSIADDLEYEISFENEVKNIGKIETPLQEDRNLDSLKEECYTCPMFQICNGCKKHIKDLKKSNMVEEHCVKMKTLANEIIEKTEEYTKTEDFRYKIQGHYHKPGQYEAVKPYIMPQMIFIDYTKGKSEQ